MRIPVGTLLLLAIAGCAAPAGPVDSSTPPPNAGTASASGRLVWKDATGAFVAYDSLLYQDDRGYLWSLNPETARLYDFGAGSTNFASADCSGEAYAGAAQPRFPFRLAGESAWRVRPDALASIEVVLGSALTVTGTCQTLTNSTPTRVVPIARLIAGIAEPTFSFAPPLHMERER